MESLDAMIEAAQTVQADREMGQCNMFSPSHIIGGQPQKDLLTPDVEDWPSRRKLRFEKEATGLYLSGHPLKNCLRQIERLATHNTQTIMNAQHKGEVRLGGVVSSVRETVTKRGDKMAFVTFEDLKGTLDVIVFSDLYSKISDLLKSDEPLLVTGSVELSEDTAKIIASDIEWISRVSETRISRVCIRLPDEVFHSEKLHQLKFILSRHPGACPVILELNVKKPSHEIQMLLGLKETIRVAPTESLIADIENFLGREVIRFE